MKRLVRAGYISALLVLAVTGAAAAEKLKIGYINVMDDAPVHVAWEAGYYREQGLEVEIIQFSSGTDLIKGIVTGRLDAGVLGFTNALTWAAQGADLRVVGGAQQGYHSILVRKGSSIRSVGDLKGRSLATQKQGSTADFVLGNVVLPQAGLRKTDLTMRYVSPAVAVQALVAGAVDAAFLFEPYDRIARATAAVEEIYEIGEVWPFPCMVVITSGKTLKARPGAIRSLLAAQKKAIELLESDPAEAARLITPYFIPSGYLDTPKGRIEGTRIIEEAIEANSFSWELSSGDIARMKEIAAMMAEDPTILSRPVDVDAILDLSWQEEVVR